MRCVVSARELAFKCFPFQKIERAALAQLKSRMKIFEFRRGQTLLRRTSKAADTYSFLVGGTAELRRSFFDRAMLYGGSDRALEPLDSLLLGEGGQIVAIEDCVVVRIARNAVDDALAAAGSNAYDVAALSDADLTDDYLVSDGAVAGVWLSRLLQSPLAQNLPASIIQQLLTRVISQDVAKGEAIVRRGSVGDAFYIVLRGVACVQTEVEGIHQGREIALLPGEYFGEEALVADVPRNA